MLGLSQLKRLSKMIEIRRKNHELFTQIIDSCPTLFYNIKNPATNSSFCLPFICKSAEIMKAMKEVFDKHGIEYRPVVAGNLLTQPFLKDYKIDTKRTVTNADTINNQGVYIGNNHFVTEKDMAYLKQVVGEIVEKFR